MALNPIEITALSATTAIDGTSEIVFQVAGGGPNTVFKASVNDLLAVAAINSANIMYTDTYDPSKTGVVQDSSRLNGQPGSYYLDLANATGLLSQSLVSGLAASLALLQPTDEKDQPGGYAGLNADGKILLSTLPVVPLTYEGHYDANLGTPALTDATGTVGQFYIVQDAGTQNLGSGNITMAIGGYLIHDGTKWSYNDPAVSVASVNGYTGVVTLTTADVAEATGFRYVTDDQKDALNGANAPSAANPFATQADLVATSVRGDFGTYLFADGQVLGDGTSRVLNTLGYATNAAAQAVWTRVDADPRFTIDVTTMTIDWIALQEAFLAMEQDQQNVFNDYGDRTYVINQRLFLPRTQVAYALERRSQTFQFYWGGSQIINLTSTDFPILTRELPADQTNASALGYNQYQYKTVDLVLRGNYANGTAGVFDDADPNANDTGMLMACCKQPIFDNVKCYEFGAGFDLIFSLNATFRDCGVQSCTQYGALLRSAHAWPFDTDQIVEPDLALGGPGVNGSTGLATSAPNGAVTDAGGSLGDYWDIEVAGTHDYGSGPIATEVGGILIHDGAQYQYTPPTWPGASANNSQSNRATFINWYDYADNTPYVGLRMKASIYQYASGSLRVDSATIEGEADDRESWIVCNNARSTTVKQLAQINNVWGENTGASRAGFRIKGDSGSVMIENVFPQGSAVFLPVLIEASNISLTQAPMSINVYDIEYNLGWKFRQRGTQGWYVRSVPMLNPTFDNAANWDVSFSGVIPTKFSYTPPISN